ncbi:MAG: Dickkopf N-terminal cysteine-rich domain-containing protein, partial [Thermomicrobiales bacterium]
MDQRSFDRLARLLGRATSRRSGIKAALGAALGLGAIDASARGATDRHSRPATEGPATEGPCGSGSRKDNVCKKNSQCCTGICELATGKKNKDKKGRCRCLANGKTCGQDKNCCSSSVCFKGVCGDCRRKNQTCDESTDCCGDAICFSGSCQACRTSAQTCSADADCCSGNRCIDGTCAPCAATGKTCSADADCCSGAICLNGTCASCLPAGEACLVPSSNDDKRFASIPCCGNLSCFQNVCTAPKQVSNGDPCTIIDTCKDPDATCTTYEFDSPAGTYCLLPRKAVCETNRDCVSRDCPGGICIGCSHPACIETCTPTVCPSCLRKTVQAAIDHAADGDVIVIDTGTYSEDLVITKSLTLRACPGRPVTLQNATYNTRTISVNGNVSLNIIDITVEGLADPDNGLYGGGIMTDGDLALYRNASVRSGAWANGAGILAGPT